MRSRTSIPRARNASSQLALHPADGAEVLRFHHDHDPAAAFEITHAALVDLGTPLVRGEAVVLHGDAKRGPAEVDPVDRHAVEVADPVVDLGRREPEIDDAPQHPALGGRLRQTRREIEQARPDPGAARIRPALQTVADAGTERLAERGGELSQRLVDDRQRRGRPDRAEDVGEHPLQAQDRQVVEQRRVVGDARPVVQGDPRPATFVMLVGGHEVHGHRIGGRAPVEVRRGRACDDRVGPGRQPGRRDDRQGLGGPPRIDEHPRPGAQVLPETDRRAHPVLAELPNRVPLQARACRSEDVRRHVHDGDSVSAR